MKTGCPDPALDGSVTRFPARTSGAWAGALGVCVRGGRASSFGAGSPGVDLRRRLCRQVSAAVR